MDSPVFSFDQLPQAVSQLHLKVDSLLNLLTGRQALQQPPPDEWLDVPATSKYLGLAEQTVYQNKEIPRHKRGKKLWFLKSELNLYLKNGKDPNQNDAAENADTFLSNRKKRKEVANV